MQELTSQQKKNYLRRYRRVVQRIDRKYQEIAQWHDRAGLKATEYTDMPKGGGGSNQLEDSIMAIVEIEQSIRQEIIELCRVKKQIQVAIEAVEDDTLKLLLELRYIDGLTFEEIAVQMNYSWRNLMRMHGKALKQVDLS